MHQAAKFHPNRTMQRNVTSGFALGDTSVFSECQSLAANHFNLRYNYFQFGETNVRHIGILLPVTISNISP